MSTPINLDIEGHTRQGDVMIIRINAIPPEARPAKRDAQRKGCVIAEGEATGHAHIVRDKDVSFYEDSVKDHIKYLEAPGGFTLEHLKDGAPTREHNPHHLAPGIYALVGQMEYDPDAAGEWERVRD